MLALPTNRDVCDQPELTGDDLAFLAKCTGTRPSGPEAICDQRLESNKGTASKNASTNNKLLHMDAGCFMVKIPGR
ncbi:hypothetical protein WJX77_011386 [Trebouxia sp. C0004]